MIPLFGKLRQDNHHEFEARLNSCLEKKKAKEGILGRKTVQWRAEDQQQSGPPGCWWLGQIQPDRPRWLFSEAVGTRLPTTRRRRPGKGHKIWPLQIPMLWNLSLQQGQPNPRRSLASRPGMQAPSLASWRLSSISLRVFPACPSVTVGESLVC